MQYLTLFLIFIIFPASLLAEETRYYDVELIIFEHLLPENRRAEHWRENIERKIPDIFIELNGELPEQLTLSKHYIPELNFKKLPSTTYHLLDEVAAIEKSDSRRVLLHTAWVQPGLPQDTSIDVHLNQTFPAIYSNDLSNDNPEQTLQTPTMVSGSGTLDALIRVSLARYLHVETDLLLTYNEILRIEDKSDLNNHLDFEKETTKMEDPSLEPLPNQYHITQSRNRIRSTELHYLDHPLLGMLFIFTKHEVAVENKPEDKPGIKNISSKNKTR